MRLTSLVLRSLKQAYYDQRNLGHAGLQLARYCHFTSPIRRYPDLVCHRALLSAVTGDEPAPEAAWVAEAGPWSSAREREAMSIERDADDIASCFLLERCAAVAPIPSDAFDGEVVGLAGAGAFVAFGPRGEFEGLLPVRLLRGDWWELNEQGTMLVGTRGGATIRLGDPVRVRVGEDRRSARPGRPAARAGRWTEPMAKGRKRKAAAGDVATQPAGVVPLQPARAVRVRDRADRDRGQVAARGQAPSSRIPMRSCATARCG